MPRITNVDELQIDHDESGHGILWSNGLPFATQDGLMDFNDVPIWVSATGRVQGVGQGSLVVFTHDVDFAHDEDTQTLTDAAENGEYPLAAYFTANTGNSRLCSAEVDGDDVIVRLDAVPGGADAAQVRVIMLRV